MNVTMKNSKTGDQKKVKIGWSWVLFFFYGFGVPLFMRKMYGWLVYLIVYYVILIAVNLLAPQEVGSAISGIFGLINIGIAIYLGIKGNKITAKNYLKLGYDFVDPESNDVKFAKTKWGIS